jgi:DNA-binding MarR family transcriptional regulator
VNEDLTQELQTHLWTLMRKTRQNAPPIEGVSRSAARVLVTVARQAGDEGVPPGRIAETLAMATSNVAAALRELDEAGYIDRRRSTEDGRRVEVALTTRGARALAERRALRVDALRDAIDAALDDDEQAQLAAVIPLLQRVAGIGVGTADASPARPENGVMPGP